jgi:hypothetical protein
MTKVRYVKCNVALVGRGKGVGAEKAADVSDLRMLRPT